jgi:hypothetical protein
MVDAARRFDAFVKEAKSSSVPELHRLAKTMSRWRTEILAHHRTGASNGPTEAVNLLAGSRDPRNGLMSWPWLATHQEGVEAEEIVHRVGARGPPTRGEGPRAA